MHLLAFLPVQYGLVLHGLLANLIKYEASGRCRALTHDTGILYFIYLELELLEAASSRLKQMVFLLAEAVATLPILFGVSKYTTKSYGHSHILQVGGASFRARSYLYLFFLLPLTATGGF